MYPVHHSASLYKEDAGAHDEGAPFAQQLVENGLSDLDVHAVTMRVHSNDLVSQLIQSMHSCLYMYEQLPTELGPHSHWRVVMEDSHTFSSHWAELSHFIVKRSR